MNSLETIKLIDGVFDKESAKEIILTMIDKKIEFNEMHSFRNLINNNQRDSDIEDRIKSLKKAKLGIIEYLNSATLSDVKIDAIIKIQPSKE